MEKNHPPPHRRCGSAQREHVAGTIPSLIPLFTTKPCLWGLSQSSTHTLNNPYVTVLLGLTPGKWTSSHRSPATHALRDRSRLSGTTCYSGRYQTYALGPSTRYPAGQVISICRPPTSRMRKTNELRRSVDFLRARILQRLGLASRSVGKFSDGILNYRYLRSGRARQTRGDLCAFDRPQIPLRF